MDVWQRGLLRQLGKLLVVLIKSSVSSNLTISAKLLLLKSFKNAGVAEWLNAADCKSVPKGTLVQIQTLAPYSCSAIGRGTRLKILTV